MRLHHLLISVARFTAFDAVRTARSLITAALVCAAVTSLDALTLPDVVWDASIDPFRQVGYVSAGNSMGTGFVAHHRAIVVTAGHLCFDDLGIPVPGGSLTWQPAQGRTTSPPGDSKSLRAYVVYTGPSGYAAMVVSHGPNSAEAFDQDLAFAYGYQDIVDYDPLPTSDDPATHLKSGRSKRIVGFAGAFYQDVQRPANSPQAYDLHATTPDTTVFSVSTATTSQFFRISTGVNATNLLAAPGASGSPLLVLSPEGSWQAAGVVVAAAQDFLLTPSGQPPEYGGRAGVRSLGPGDINALVAPLIPGFDSPPTIAQDVPEALTVIVGDSLEIPLVLDGWGPMTLELIRDGTVIRTASQFERFVISNAQATDAGAYQIKATNRHGSVTSRPCVVSVTRRPVIQSQPVSTTVAYGGWVSFTFTFRAEAPYSIQWFLDEQAIPGATSSYYHPGTSATFAHEGVYRARVRNDFGEAWTDPATLSVTFGSGVLGGIGATSTSPAPADRVIIEPSLATEPGITFQWKHDGVAIPGATLRVLDLGRVDPEEWGRYSLAITHPRGATESATLTLVPSTPAQFPGPTSTRHILPGDRIRLEPHLFATNVTRYQWFKDGASIDAATGPALDPGPASENTWGSYTLQATTTSGTLTSPEIRVRQAAPGFWSEIALPTGRPAVGGGTIGGEAYLFGEGWKTRIAAGATTGTVQAWTGSADVRDLTSSGGLYAALGATTEYDGVLLTSTNGQDWTITRPFRAAFRTLACGNGILTSGPIEFPVNSSTAGSITSTDGVHWDHTLLPTVWRATNMVFAQGRFVASDLVGRVMRSIDGRTWEGETAFGSLNETSDMAYSGRQFMISSRTGGPRLSEDGITWAPGDLQGAASMYPQGLVGGEGWIVALERDGRVLLTRDGRAWEVRPAEEFRIRRLIGICGNRLYAIRTDGVPLVSQTLGSFALASWTRDGTHVRGQVVRIRVSAISDGVLTYQWYRGETGDTRSPIAGATSQELSLEASDTAGRVWVRISDGTSVRDLTSIPCPTFAPGVYFAPATDGTTAVLVHNDGRAVAVRAAADGRSFQHMRPSGLIPLPASDYALTADIEARLTDRYHGTTPLRVAQSGGSISIDSVMSFGLVTQFDAASLTTGTTPAGYFRGGIPGRHGAELDLILAADGRIVAGLHTPEDLLAGTAVLAADNTATIDLGSAGRVTLTFDLARGRCTGSFEKSGAQPQPLRAILEGTDDAIRVVNLSGRAWLPNAQSVVVAGFVTAGSGTQRILARGVGPGLRAYGVDNAAGAAGIQLYRGSSRLRDNLGWETAPDRDLIESVGRQLGAFALAADSADSAMVADLDPGPYTVQISSSTGAGTVLGEIYFDGTFSGPANGRLTNISTRGAINTGGAVVVAGFVIEGDAPRQILLRGVGQSLYQFGVTDAARHAEIQLFRGTTLLATKFGASTTASGDWSMSGGQAYIARAARAVGAFDLFGDLYSLPGDSAMLVWLEPGVYTLVVRSTNGSAGTALAEVYDMPFDAPR